MIVPTLPSPKDTISSRESNLLLLGKQGGDSLPRVLLCCCYGLHGGGINAPFT